MMYLEKEFSINSININPQKQLGLFGILGMLQDAAETHARLLGFGHDDMAKHNSFWVLAQQKLLMNQWPKWLDQLTIKTWPRLPQGLKAFRDFEIYLGNEKIGECSTLFMTLDRVTRRPVRPMVGDYQYIDKHLDFVPQRVEMVEPFKQIDEIHVRNSDLDMNHHVNNTKYAQWILDAIPLPMHSTFALREFEINFLAESYLEDRINLYASSGIREGENFFMGVRQADQKKLFVARLS